MTFKATEATDGLTLSPSKAPIPLRPSGVSQSAVCGCICPNIYTSSRPYSALHVFTPHAFHCCLSFHPRDLISCRSVSRCLELPGSHPPTFIAPGPLKPAYPGHNVPGAREGASEGIEGKVTHQSIIVEGVDREERGSSEVVESKRPPLSLPTHYSPRPSES